jgi:hypothetical protein
MRFSTRSDTRVIAPDGHSERQEFELAAARAGLRGERARELALGLRQDPSRPHPVDDAQLREWLAAKKRRRTLEP